MPMATSQIEQEAKNFIGKKGPNYVLHMATKEEKEYFELIKKGLKMGNIKLGAVSLGESQDGLRTITLADIWTDENQREKSR